MIFSKDGRSLLLIQEHKSPDRWGIVGGKLEPMPSLSNLIKEVREETGYTVTVDRLVAVYHRYDCQPQRISFIYRATEVNRDSLFDRAEVIEARWFDLDTIPWDNLRFEDNRRMIRDAVDGKGVSESVIVSLPIEQSSAFDSALVLPQ